MMENNLKRRWLIVEALLLSLPALAIALYSLPTVAIGFVWIFFPVESDNRSLIERGMALIPYIVGPFGLAVLWDFSLSIANYRSFRIGIKFVLGVVAGVIACREVYAVAPLIATFVICAPVWILAVHLTYLNLKQKKPPTTP